MEMIAVERVVREFPGVAVASGTSVFADGSGEADPFLWVMGERFAFRMERGVCPDPGCVQDSQAWRFELFERTVNGPGAEYVSVEYEVAHDAAGRVLVELAALELAFLASDELLLYSALLDCEGPARRLIGWAAEVVRELTVRAGAERFASILLDEV